MHSVSRISIITVLIRKGVRIEMACREIDEMFCREGYRFLKGKPEEVGLYYKYWNEGFYVVLVIDLRHGSCVTAEQHRIMEERVKGNFYHPKGILTDFPEGFPVYHVETLTLLVGESGEMLRSLCTQCCNVWGFLPGERRLLVYENQPGEFLGLRRACEELTRGQLDAGEKAKRLRFDQSMPWVTIGLVAINFIVYLILEFFGDTTDGRFIAAHGGMHPALLLYEHQWWRLFTAGFLHFGAAHLVNNMLILCCMGFRVERIAGHLRMLAIYMVSLLGGSLLSFGMMLWQGAYAVSAGASGAVFGIIGGFLWMAICDRGRMGGATVRKVLFMLALTTYYGFTTSGVDAWCHVGGALSGFLTAMVLYHRKYQKY